MSVMPAAHSGETRLSKASDRLIALLPVLIWSVYIFGARVITLCALSVGFCFGLDYFVQRYAFRAPAGVRTDPYNAVYGLCAALLMPVAAPLWAPVLAAAFTVAAKNIHYRDTRRVFNPYIFSAAAMNLLFRGMMTCYTRPLAYFNAFSFVIDGGLIEKYRVLSPLQYMAGGSVYEDGLLPQFIGFSQGTIGEIAILALMLGSVWMFLRRDGNVLGTFTFCALIFVLAYAFPSKDAEPVYYVFGTLFSGAMIFIAVHALNDGATMPMNSLGRVIVAAVCAVLIFAGRKIFPGFECGYYVILAANAASPFVEKLTRPRVPGTKKKAAKSG
ncbi:MAG: RnfABCDGE type electron transport complex subunit D [Clostridia bacterium]|nr:RnfABCDGE type electron transport complex subunit D [Clostridia bacterium]